jgi:type I restriction enzyme M protein
LEEDDEPFEQKVARLTKEWRDLQAEAHRLDALIDANLQALANEG